MGVRHEVDLRQETRVFQVTVGDVARWVVVGHQAALHGVREWFPPDEGIAPAVEVHSSHAVLGSVRGAE